MKKNRIIAILLIAVIILPTLFFTGCGNKEYDDKELLEKFALYISQKEYQLDYEATIDAGLLANELGINLGTNGAFNGILYKDVDNKKMDVSYDMTINKNDELETNDVGELHFYLDENNILYGKHADQEDWVASDIKEYINSYKDDEYIPEYNVEQMFEDFYNLVKDTNITRDDRKNYKLEFVINTKDLMDYMYSGDANYYSFIEKYENNLENTDEITKMIAEKIKVIFDTNLQVVINFDKKGNPLDFQISYALEDNIDLSMLANAIKENYEMQDVYSVFENTAEIEDSTEITDEELNLGLLEYKTVFSMNAKFSKLEEKISLPEDIS